METILKSAMAGAALLGFAMSSTAQADGTMPAYPFAATGFVGGGYSWMTYEDNGGEYEISRIVAGGDFLIPVTGFWNIQLGGAWNREESIIPNQLGTISSHFQGGGIGFWRDQNVGLLGVEAGAYGDDNGSPCCNFSYAKIGGVAEYYFSDAVTIGGFGGVLVPLSRTSAINDGYYAGGHVTWYVSDDLALSAFTRYAERNRPRGQFVQETESLRAGGKVRFLTPVAGTEMYLSGAYRRCEETSGNSNELDTGFELMAGVSIHLGGQSASLVSIDRSNTVDTRAWLCTHESVDVD